jgi:proteasome lid subunit RPN8/RPN11
MIPLIKCPRPVIEQTLSVLRAGGARDCEALVLWLARRTPGVIDVVEAYEPPYKASVDYFRIHPNGMRSIMSRLRTDRLHICAQVHSHPGKAFHSTADDRWAIVRHQGALSLVVPDFAATTSTDSFLNKIAAYALSPADQWLAVPRHELGRYLEVTHADGSPGK